MNGDILALDVGTSAFKLGVFSPELEKRCETQRSYNPRLYDQGKADIEPDLWWQALRECCAEVRGSLANVGVISLSVTTPALTPMAADGAALAPAVLFLDGRSHEQSAGIRRIVGEERFLRETCNLPVSGGASLSTILWFRDHRPETWSRAAKFGHCNTYMAKRLTGRWAIDPSTVSMSGLYNTARNDLTWNTEILALAGVAEERLPTLMQSYDPVGPLLPAIADELGLPRGCTVLCGGNDAVLAAFSSGHAQLGDVSISSGTCDIASVCTDQPVSSPNFNVRCHVIPGLWLTFFVQNAGGTSLEWFHRVFCADLDDEQFFGEYLPQVLERFLGDPDLETREAELPQFVPYLAGSRYTTERLKGSYNGLTLETTRDDLLVSLVRGNMRYLGDHLREVGKLVRLHPCVRISGGAARARGMLAARQRWTGDFDYVFQDQSSLLGAAMLGRICQTGVLPGRSPSTTHEDHQVMVSK